MSLRVRHLLSLLALAAAAGCGSDDEPEGEKLPAATVSQLERRLDEIGRRFSDARDNDNPGACSDIERDSFPAIEDLIAGLPDDVDPDVRSATEDSFQRLRELTSEGCADVKPAQTETVAPETEIETVPPETVPAETETTPPATNTTPSDQDEDNGNGDGNGNGRGNGGTPPGQGEPGGGLGAPGGGD